MHSRSLGITVAVTPSKESVEPDLRVCLFSELLSPDLESLKRRHQIGADEAAIAFAGSVQRPVNTLKLLDSVSVSGGHDGCVRHTNPPELLSRHPSGVFQSVALLTD